MTTPGERVLRTMTRYEIELMEAGPVGKNLPYRFKNGKEFDNIAGICKFCSTRITGPNLLGKVVPFDGTMVRVDTMAVCEECGVVTISHYRIYDDFRMVSQREGGGWRTWIPRLAWYKRLVNIMLFRRA